MKKVLYLTLALVSVVLMGCENSIIVNKPTVFMPTAEGLDISMLQNGASSGLLLGGYPLIVVKFENPEDAQKVLVGYNTTGYSDEGIPYNYTYNQRALGLYLPTFETIDGDTIKMAGVYGQEQSPNSDYLEKVLQICGTSPFIELVNDYYLVDWKWVNILPCCVGLDAKYCNDYCFVANDTWSELTTVYTTWRKSQVSDMRISEKYLVVIPLIDIYRCGEAIDIYFGYNQSLYHGGLHADVTWDEFRYHDEAMPLTWNHEKLVNMMDSLQNVYRETLMLAIENNDMNKIAHEYLY